MKKSIAFILALAMTAGLTACGGSNSGTTSTESAAASSEAADTSSADNSGSATDTSNAEYTIKVGHTLQENTPSHEGFVKFKEEVEKNSNGRIAVEIYPNSALGSERVMYEACQMGTLEVAYGTSSVLANFDSKLKVLDLPFLFENEDAARKAVNGKLGDAAAEGLEDIGLVKLTYLENGMRMITNSARPINTPDDLKGLKIRTMENDIHMKAFELLGASPTPMAFTELFTALQQKTVDAQENPIFLIQTSRFDEVQKYLSLTGHLYTSGVVTINKQLYDSLPEDLQKVLMDAADVAREYQYELCDKQNAEALEYLKTKMEVNEITPENRQLFVEKTAPVYDQVASEIGQDLVDIAKDAQAGNY